MDDNQDKTGTDPEERAFSGHPDHPPEDSDQPAAENQELLREDGIKGENGRTKAAPAPETK